MDERDKAISIAGSYNNAVSLLKDDEDFQGMDIDEGADALKLLADAIFERKVQSFKDFKVGSTSTGSGKAKSGGRSRGKTGGKGRSSGRSGSSAKRGSSRSGNDGPSAKQIQFYNDLTDQLSDNNVALDNYPENIDDESFDDAKVLISDLVDLRDERGLGF